MAHTLGLWILVIMISTSFGQTRDSLIDDFIESLFSTTLSPKSCGVQKECVPFYRCKADDTDDSSCAYPNTCCDVAHKIATTQPTPPTEDPTLSQEVCGYRNVGPNSAGSAENLTDFGEYPWLAALMKGLKERGLNDFFCSAVLIAPTAVLTSASCAAEASKEIFVQVGVYPLDSKDSNIQRKRRVDKIITHESYDAPSRNFNIALLVVESPFEWEEKVRPVCLPQPNVSFDEAHCYAPSLNVSHRRPTNNQEVLKRVDSTIVPKDQCQAKLGPHILVPPTDFCAGAKKFVDFDVYDQGMPLACPVSGVKERYFLAGIESFVKKEKEDHMEFIPAELPRRYVNVVYLLPWIQAKLIEHNISLSQSR